jgi:hypothetical protein
VSHATASGQPLGLRVPSPLVELRDDRLTRVGLRLFLKREDLINPDIPGNKWRKLKYNLVAAKEQGQHVLLTFGGAYSNHIRATAAAGHYFGFASIGVIRGEEHLPLNASLDYAVRQGMRLTYLDRAAYREKMSPEVIAMLHRQFGEFYLLPEGGSNADALRGCAEIAGEIDRHFDLICCPAGPAPPSPAWPTGCGQGNGRWASRCSRAGSSSRARCPSSSMKPSAHLPETGLLSTVFIVAVSPGAIAISTSSSLTSTNDMGFAWTGFTLPR